jgi:hypothetical protein
MAKYNTFVVYDCKKRKNILITSSARKARGELHKGMKIEVWNENNRVETIYSKNFKRITDYVSEEKEYIRNKQIRAEERNRQRRMR